MPRFAGLEFEFETDPAVGVDRLGIALVRRDGDPALEVLVDIGDREACSALRPCGGDSAPPDDAAGLHFEDVGKVAAHRDLKVELHLAHAVIDQIEILMDSAVDGTADRKTEGMFRNLADLGVNGRIGEEDAVGVVGDVSAVQELPRFAVGEDLP